MQSIYFCNTLLMHIAFISQRPQHSFASTTIVVCLSIFKRTILGTVLQSRTCYYYATDQMLEQVFYDWSLFSPARVKLEYSV